MIIKFYQWFISPVIGSSCRFEPSCSFYMQQAIKNYGLFKGVVLGMKRLLRCHPGCEGGFDPVEKNSGNNDGY
jgi:putative membrane protein insertion efficiency factor